MVRSLKADGAIALMDVQEQVSLPLHSHFIKKIIKNVSMGEKIKTARAITFKKEFKEIKVNSIAGKKWK